MFSARSTLGSKIVHDAGSTSSRMEVLLTTDVLCFVAKAATMLYINSVQVNIIGLVYPGKIALLLPDWAIPFFCPYPPPP